MIEWHGGECPVNLEALVDYQLRSGSRGYARRARSLYWLRLASGPQSSDIVGYRLAEVSHGV